jgi:peptidoglycan/LPS O-acetylase OafA/YrhL
MNVHPTLTSVPDIPEPPSPQGHPSLTFFPELEAARGVAALVVVIFHVFVTLEPKRGVFETHNLAQAISNFVLTGLFNGSGAVTFFFVLSGFVLGISLEHVRAVALAGYIEFAVKRLFRIMPAVWASIALALLIQFWFFRSTFGRGEMVHMLLLQDIRLNGPLWSIKIELFASFFYPFLLFASRSLGIVFNLIGLWFIVGYGLEDTPFVFRYMAAFHLGILVPLLGRPIVGWLHPAAARWLLAGAFVAFALAAHFSRLELLNVKRQIAIECFTSFYFVSFILYANSTATSRLLTSSPLRWLGKISFSLYALHFPLHSLVFSKVADWFGDGFNAYYPLPQFIALPFVVGLSLLAAWGSNHLVERPIMNWGRLLSRKAGALIGDIQAKGIRSFTIERVPTLLLIAATIVLIRIIYLAAWQL